MERVYEDYLKKHPEEILIQNRIAEYLSEKVLYSQDIDSIQKNLERYRVELIGLLKELEIRPIYQMIRARIQRYTFFTVKLQKLYEKR